MLHSTRNIAHLSPVFNPYLEIVHELSRTAQFITTTFKPELLVHADKFYGVTFVNKVSQVQAITKDDANTFVDGM